MSWQEYTEQGPHGGASVSLKIKVNMKLIKDILEEIKKVVEETHSKYIALLIFFVTIFVLISNTQTVSKAMSNQSF